jgi:hypothetical protein
MLEGMLNSVAAFLQGAIPVPARIRMFKVIKEFSSNARADAMRTEDSSLYTFLGEAAARLDVEVSGGRYTSILVPQPGEKVTDRLSSYESGDYVEEVGIPEKGFSYGILAKGRLNNLIDVIRGVVEINKQIILKDPSTPEHEVSKMRWGYISNFRVLTESEISRVSSIRFVSNNIVSTRDHIFSIKRVHFDDLKDDYDFEICFAMKKRAQ